MMAMMAMLIRLYYNYLLLFYSCSIIHYLFLLFVQRTQSCHSNDLVQNAHTTTKHHLCCYPHSLNCHVQSSHVIMYMEVNQTAHRIDSYHHNKNEQYEPHFLYVIPCVMTLSHHRSSPLPYIHSVCLPEPLQIGSPCRLYMHQEMCIGNDYSTITWAVAPLPPRCCHTTRQRARQQGVTRTSPGDCRPYVTTAVHSVPHPPHHNKVDAWSKPVA